MENLKKFVVLLCIAIVIVTITTLLYKVIPFRLWKDKKPIFSIFPKYIAYFDRPVEEIKNSLNKRGFQKLNNKERTVYMRGKKYGDFSIKLIEIKVELDESNKKIMVYASFFGIVFDTGDTWQLVHDVLRG